ncbi:MAG: FtsX-like permease family protein [Burkholderiales bacterium]
MKILRVSFAQATALWTRIQPQIGLAARNVFRQRRRSAFGVVSVGAGVIALLLAAGFIEWNFWAMREGAIRSRIGHVQVVRSGFFEQGTADPFKFLLPDDSRLLAVVAQEPGVATLAPRLAFTGLIALGDSTLSFLGEGMEPDKEAAFGFGFTIRSGSSLSSSAPTGVIVGHGLALNLGVKAGDAITLLSNTRDGGINGVDAVVRGTFSTDTNTYDDVTIRVPLGLAQRLVRTNRTHSWVLLLHETGDTDRVVTALAKKLAPLGLQAVPWHELADFYKKTVSLFSKQVGLMKLIIGLIIMLSIVNTLMSAVIERTGEIGTNMALGVPRGAILRQFLLEGAMIGMVGGLAGVAFGWILALSISAIGIPMPPPPGMSQGYIGEIRVTAGLALDAFVLAIFTTLAAAAYPAWRASRLEIVDALRHNR